MRKIMMYIATSLDGKIADIEGGVDWLNDVPNPEKSDYGYRSFYGSIDTVLMGNTTYQQVRAFGMEYPYKGKITYVITRDVTLSADDHATFISDNVIEFTRQLKTRQGKDIWLVGGGQLNAYLLDHGLVDELLVFVMPVILSEGIPLTAKLVHPCKLELIDSKTYGSGVIQLHYKVFQ